MRPTALLGLAAGLALVAGGAARAQSAGRQPPAHLAAIHVLPSQLGFEFGGGGGGGALARAKARHRGLFAASQSYAQFMAMASASSSPCTAGGEQRGAGAGGPARLAPSVDCSPLVVGSVFEARAALRAGFRDPDPAARHTTVWLHGGLHVLDRTLVLTHLDSGTATHGIRWASFPGDTERAVLTGGRPVDPAAFRGARVPSKAEGVVVADLVRGKRRVCNTTDLGSLAAMATGGRVLELFYQDLPMHRARDPNIGTDELRTWKWHGYENLTNTTGALGQALTWTDNHTAPLWEGIVRRKNRTNAEKNRTGSSADALWLFGYWHFDWWENWIKVESIAKNRGRANASNDAGPAGVGKNRTRRRDTWTVAMSNTTLPRYPAIPGCRFFAVGDLALLDAAGEYYTSPEGLLYFLPPAPLRGDTKLVVSVLGTALLSQNTRHTSFHNLTVSDTQGNAVVFNNATSVVVDNVTVANSGGHCMLMDGTGIRVKGSTFYGCGSGGLSITSGDVATLAPGTSSVSTSTFANFSRVHRTYTPGLSYNGVGLHITGNTLENAPHTAVTGSGNNHVFEHNTIRHAGFECTDVGAMYIGNVPASWSQRGNVVRHNVFDTCRATERLAQDDATQSAFYLDDQMSGYTFEHNTIINAANAIQVGGGRRNVIAGNVFVGNDLDILFDNRGMNWQADECKPNGPFFQELESLNYKHAPYAREYPYLANISQDRPCVPVLNVFANNTYCHTSAGARFMDASRAQVAAWNSSYSNNTEFNCTHA